MTSLQVDSDALRLAATKMRAAAAVVPQGLAIDAGGCGSPAVVRAVEDFNMWAKLSGQAFSNRIANAADDADAAATAWDAQEAALAASLGGH